MRPGGKLAVAVALNFPLTLQEANPVPALDPSRAEHHAATLHTVYAIFAETRTLERSFII
jgi:hypothetical protein